MMKLKLKLSESKVYFLLLVLVHVLILQRIMQSLMKAKEINYFIFESSQTK